MRKLRVVAGAVAVGLTVASCGGVSSNVGGGDGGEGSGSKNLRVSGFGSGTDEIATVRLDMVREELGLKLRLNKGAFDEQQFLTSVAADNPPDVLNISRDTVGSYAQRGALMPLEECIANENIDTSQYREQAMSQLEYDGKIYAIPEFYNYPVLLVNNRVAEEAGVDPASIDTGDWDSLVEMAEKMTVIEDGDLVRLGFDPQLPDASMIWPAIHGVELLAEDGLTANLDDPAMVDVWANLNRLVEAQGGWTRLKSFKDSWDFFGAKNPFVTDQLGALVVEQWYLTVLAETAPTEVDFTAVPILGADGEPVTIQNGGSWVIPAGSKNPEAACQFAKMMTSPEAWTAAAQGKVDTFDEQGKYYAGTYTGNIEADKEIFGPDNQGGIWQPQGGDMAQFDEAVQSALELQSHAIVEPASPIGAQVNTAVNNALNRVLQGEQDAAASLAQAQNEVDKAASEIQ